jgi:hydrogenase/urease accessory protein HupE
MNFRFFTLVGVFWLALLVCSGVARPANAHQTAMSTLNVEIRPESREIDLLLAVSAADVATFLKLDPNGDGYLEFSERPQVRAQFEAYLSPKIRVLNNGEYCKPSAEGLVKTDRRMSALFYRETAVCAAPLGELTLVNRVLLADSGGYTHYGRIQLGPDIHTAVFTRDAPTYRIEVVDDGHAMAEQGFFEVFADFVWQGVLHILLGLDHVLFVLCLLLAAGNFRRLLRVITCFTVAHSVTLALSSLNIVTLSPGFVEPLIALSIAWVAIEILLAQADDAGGEEPIESIQPESSRFEMPHAAGTHLYLLTFLFGLLHGFGFSYVLRDEVGLPADALAPALFSFNVGVELGQLAVVCVAFPLIVWMRRKSWGHRVVQLLSALVLAVSLYWLVIRLM